MAITAKSLAEEIVKQDNYQLLRHALTEGTPGGSDGVAATAEVKDKIAKAVQTRAEYQTLWAAQKSVAKARADIQGDLNSDPALKALINQKGLETTIENHVLVKLATSREELDFLLDKWAAEGTAAENARMLANMGYAYILMAQHFKVARGHVMAIVSKDTMNQKLVKGLKFITVTVLKAAITASMGVLSAGITSALIPAISQALKEGAATTRLKGVGTGALSDAIAGKLDEKTNEIGKKVKGAGTSGGMTVAKKVAAAIITNNPGEIKDPYDFFIEKEVELRKAAAGLASIEGGDEAMKAVDFELDQKMSFTALKADPYWGWFKNKHSSDDLSAKWGEISELLAVYMRRMCWRLYCRSLWNNTIFNYTLNGTKTDSDSFGDLLASEWDYKAWRKYHTAFPPHWEKMCSDFKGPEHDPNHTITVDRGLVAEAARRFKNNAWISMAAVQCCQIRTATGFHIDLEKRSHFGGSEGEKVPVPPRLDQPSIQLTDADIVFKGRDRVDEKFLRKIMVGGGIQVQISEVRVGERGSHAYELDQNDGQEGKAYEIE